MKQKFEFNLFNFNAFPTIFKKEIVLLLDLQY